MCPLLQTLFLNVRLNGSIRIKALIQLKLIIKVSINEELSAIEIRTIRNEIANSEVECPVVRFMIAPRKELMHAYTIKQIKG